MHRLLFLPLVSVIFPLVASGGTLSPIEEAKIRNVMRETGEAVIARGAPGAAISVVYRGHRLFEAFGTDGLNRPITIHTLFEIGSNTKTFTTTLLGLDIARGKLRANDKAQDFLPDIELTPEMQEATLGQLADFTSSLPDLPPAVRHKPTVQRGLKYFTIEDYFDFIQNWEPKGQLPANYLYSNSSVGLLGYCLVEDTTLDGIGRWYHRVRKEILNPLAMHETTPWPNATQQKRVSAGFYENGNRAPAWPLQAWAAAGALRSSASDLTKYVSAYLGETPVSSKLKRAMQIATKPRYSVSGNGGRFDQALAWAIHKIPTALGPKRLILKDGGTAGFSSVVSFSREADIGIVVLINKENQVPVAVAVNLFRNLVNLRAMNQVVEGGTLPLETAGVISVLNPGYVASASFTMAIDNTESGLLVLNGASTYSGTTRFNSSTLNLGAGILLPNTVTVADGFSLTLATATATVTGASLKVNNSTVTLNGTAKVVILGGSLDLNGVIYDLTGKTLTIGNGSILLDTEDLGAFPPVP